MQNPSICDIDGVVLRDMQNNSGDFSLSPESIQLSSSCNDGGSIAILDINSNILSNRHYMAEYLLQNVEGTFPQNIISKLCCY